MRAHVFGRDPKTYQRARLPYPKRVYEILTSRCGLGAGAVAFEIGPGTGIATRELLRRGVDSLTLIEPDRRLARYLATSLGPTNDRVTIQVRSFESVQLTEAGFDLGVAATSFHWLPERRSLRKVARALKPGGWWATWNNHHGDPQRPSPFHRALQPLYRELSSGGRGSLAVGHSKSAAASDRMTRMRALRSVTEFDQISREDFEWTVTMDAARVKALWGTFSEIVTLGAARRERFLTELERIVEADFSGQVTFPMLTPIYTARRV